MNPHSSMRAFLMLWFGQLVSVIGTGMTQFALALWIWEQTGEVTPVMLTTVCFFLPSVLFAPFAGTLIDRLNRKWLMIGCDTLAGAVTLALFILTATGSLEVWHLYISAFLSGTFQTLQAPALRATIVLLVPPQHLTRASGMMGLSSTMNQILAPVLAAVLYSLLQLNGIFVIDFITFLFALTTLVIIHIPIPAQSEANDGTFWQQTLYGFRYILNDKRIRALLLFYLGFNVVVEVWSSLLSPLILARTASDAGVLATVQAAGGIGAVVAGVLLSVLPSPRNLNKAMLICVGVMGVLTLPIGLNNAVAAWMFAHLAFFIMHAVFLAYGYSIEQQIVPQPLQGRVFSIFGMVLASTPVVMPGLLGLLSDTVFEPAMRGDSLLMQVWGWLVGTGPGAGMAVLFVVCSLGMIGLAGVGMANPVLRHLVPPQTAARKAATQTTQGVSARGSEA